MPCSATSEYGIQTHRSNSISAMHFLNMRTFGDKTELGKPLARHVVLEHLMNKHGARTFRHINKINAALSRIELKARTK